MKLADDCYSNIFVNEHHDTELGKTTEGTDTNISIIGRGKAILDGGEYNGLKHSKYNLWMAFMILPRILRIWKEVCMQLHLRVLSKILPCMELNVWKVSK